ncbi:MAG TPA: APC family permease [Thermoleophilaceae bacterium]
MTIESQPPGGGASAAEPPRGVEYRHEGGLVIESVDVNQRDDVHRLHAGAVGLVGVLFLAVTGAAPLTAMLGNVPYAVGFGNGIGAPSGFWIATIVLTVFSVGYVAMARKLTASGGFYSFISHGLGRPVGLASGWTAMACYMIFEASLMGIFAFFAKDTFNRFLHIDIGWGWYAFAGLIIISLLTYFDVRISARVLGVALITEVLILLIMDFGILFSGGGPDGLSAKPLSPSEGFSSVGGGAAAVGIFFAFWSWVGFEATVNYGEESRNPKKIVPRATYIAVIALGIFYTFTSWMVISGWGHDEAIKQAQNDATNFFFTPTQDFVGTLAKDIMQWVIVTGSFACGMAFHNAASRYFYNLGRERVFPAALGRTHPKWHSPYAGSLFQSAMAAILVAIFVILDKDPYVALYGWLAVLGTFGILLVQSLTAISSFSYFERYHKEDVHWWRTRLAPILGAAGMIAVLVLLITKLTEIGGDVGFIKAVPFIVAGWFVLGLLLAYYLKLRDPRRYQVVGRMIDQGVDT